ncbi:hypothetical protein EDD68_10978 [Melghiribacillus thermohalophilus]|uniref:Uncharacterized protein n=1 Tax=Melghiribacillus thermohalophilus TaxID=1324956 RepID=A0A4R3N2P4_9BACI|nr:hypothetical protein [Melghiribacillus thermohalophilus]TCT22431.1 hypothetical protein EDD68_10978 [Melghiribacillus thermohalophilus]
MKVVIENCFHWLGFHLTGTYLDKGYSIIGIDPLDDPKKEFLYDFFGRNSEFIFFDRFDAIRCHPDQEFLIYRFPPASGCMPGKKGKTESVRITDEDFASQPEPDDGGIVIQAPNVIGPWMDQKDFVKKSKKNNIIYVDDFINWVYFQRWRKEGQKWITTRHNDEYRKIIHVTIDREEAVKKVEKHIQSFPSYYEL